MFLQVCLQYEDLLRVKAFAKVVSWITWIGILSAIKTLLNLTLTIASV
jgi:hypothetical protein